MGELSFISWNICRSISEKLTNPEFVSIISDHDVIFLSECWINPGESVKLDGYDSFIFTRKLIKGGGIVVFCKSCLSSNICIVENIYDCIIWIKLSTSIDKKDIFLAFCYLPPENSVFYDCYNIDTCIFQLLEESISKYKNIGSVYVTGDLNARTGTRIDFINDDYLKYIVPEKDLPFVYENERELCRRNNFDVFVNNYGRKLLDLCKSSGLRIVNGRHPGDKNGEFTFYCSRGSSLIDYLLTDSTLFDSIGDFSSGTFNIFSDHSPVCFTITGIHLTLNCHKSTGSTGRTNSKSLKWNDDNTQAIMNELSCKLELLYDTIDVDFVCSADINRCIDNICSTINGCVLPYIHVKASEGTTPGKPLRHTQMKKDKPWFDEKCKRLLKDYKGAIYKFNTCKSFENKQQLLHAKKKYKQYENKLKRNYKQHEGDMLDYLRKHNPKHFFSLFGKGKGKSMKSSLTNDDFYAHFKGLIERDEGDPTDNYYDITNTEPVYEELDKDITCEEISKAIHKLKCNKSCSEDCILNELFIKCQDVLMPLIHNLFNKILASGIYPELWTKNCIVPLHKKGDADDVNNFRGISIVSCFGKLFTSILNTRLLEWDNENNILTDAQFGFRPGMSTVDAIFVLQSLINKTLKNKRRLYCCFVDFQKAFDSVNRYKLWFKLFNVGIRGKLLQIIQSLYSNVKSCVKYDGFLSEYFQNEMGLMQGEVLSPLLFSLYVNDFEINFVKNNCPSIEWQMINIFLLMYADDMVILAETPSGLQSMLNTLYKYTREWDLNVNVPKTKIVVFRNGGNVTKTEKWIYNGQVLEVVNTFNYLGMLFNHNGKFLQTQKHVAEQGRKALFAISNTLKNNYFNIETQGSVFDTYVHSILSYACEIWGFHKAPDVEKVHLNFCKKLLGVNKRTNNSLVYCELGRFPLQIRRKLRIFKYWLKIKNTNNCILKECYEGMITTNDSWVINIKNELSNLGLRYLFEDPCINQLKTFKIIELRLLDIYKQSVLSYFTSSSKCVIYQHLIDNFCLQSYLRRPINPSGKKCIAKFRMSSHSLNIEKGRHRNVARNMRLCELCDHKDIEDEFHFILKCPLYVELRKRYIKHYYYTKPSVFKLVQLLSAENTKELNNLGKFLVQAEKLRSLSL